MSFDVGAITSKIVIDSTQWIASINRILNSDLPRLEKSVEQLSTKFRSLGTDFAISGAAISAAVGLTARSFVSANDRAEKFRLTLNATLRSQSEANRLFKEMSDFAARVTFTYEEIMGAATAFSGVMKGGVDEIKEWVMLTADLSAMAASLGVSMQEATGQILRMYSAGAQSADQFREKGITAMLGFKAGVQYTAEETRKQLMEMWKSPASQFRGLANDLAKTWSGQVSMMTDRWFLFRTEILRSTGIFDSIKAALRALNDAFDRNWSTIRDWIDTHRELVRNIAVGVAAVGGLGIALTGLGLALKGAALGLSAFAFALSPIAIEVGIVAGAFYVLRAVVNQTLAAIWEDQNEFGENTASWSEKILSIYRDGWKQFYRDYKDGIDFVVSTLRATANFIIATVVVIGKTIGTLLATIFEAVKGLFTRLLDAAVILRENFTPEKILDKDEWARTADKLAATFVDNFTFQLGNMKSGLTTALKDAQDAYTTDYVEQVITATPIVFGAASKVIWENVSLLSTMVSDQFKSDIDSMLTYLDQKAPIFKQMLDAMKFQQPTEISGPQGFGVPGGEQGSALDPNIRLKELGVRSTAEISAEIKALEEAKRIALELNDAVAIQDSTEKIRELNEELAKTGSIGQRMFGGLKAGFDQLYTKFTDTFSLMRDGVVSLATTLTDSLSSGLASVIDGTKSWGDALRDIGRTFIQSLIRIMAQMAVMIPIAIVINTLTGGAVAAAGATITTASISQALSAASGLTTSGGAGSALGGAFGRAFGGGGSSQATGFAKGIDDVPYTGYYKLHAGEQVVPAYDTTRRERQSTEQPFQIINVVGEEAIARAMAGRSGQNVIINVIRENSESNGVMRRGGN